MSFMDAREHGSKVGSAGVASAQHEAIDRRERLRRLALETIDLAKDPYFMRNHLGSYECKLCLTVHGNEGNYLAHTQGRRHQQNLAKRAARDAAERAPNPAALATARRSALRTARPKSARIGRPGYRVTKQFDRASGRRSLLFQVDFPEIEEGAKPRHRFMSAYEQKREPWDKRYQYLLIAAEPYEVIAFKVPNADVDKRQGDGDGRGGDEGVGGRGSGFIAHWEPDEKTYTLQICFKNDAATRERASGGGYAPAPGAGVPPPPPPPPGALPHTRG